MSIAIIINPISGGASPRVAQARAAQAAAIAERAGEPIDIFVTERRGHARELAARVAAQGARLVLAWGGDGTFNEVASAVAFSPVACGIVPAGSGNGLARELQVDPRPERAIADALQARPRAIDLGEIDGRLFANVAGIGFDAYVAGTFDARERGRRGLSGYVGVVMRALASYQVQQYAIAAGDERWTLGAVLVTIANSAQFGNGARIAPGARVDDGFLDLVIIPERSRWRTVCHVPKLFAGTVERIPGSFIRKVQQVVIESEKPMAFHVDGEPIQGGTRLVARVHPAALNVAVR
jgi:YegS/Rv2252/BmrU family lipid kinase